MSLGQSLVLVLFAFVALASAVMHVAFRERRLATQPAATADAQRSSDARVLVVIFAAIPAGMLLTVLAGWLVFF
jgi:Na+-transporting methylmalonyl-CoA/oxaloacetate decarboxylase gamma subunit